MAAPTSSVPPAAEEIERLLLSGPVDWFRVERPAKLLLRDEPEPQRSELQADMEASKVSRGWLAARMLAGDALAEAGEVARAARVDPRRRAAELISRPSMTAREAAETLAELYDADAINDVYWNEPHPRNQAVRDLGAKLNELGGIELMRQVHELFVRLRPPRTSPSPGIKLERVWHGIGSWRR